MPFVPGSGSPIARHSLFGPEPIPSSGIWGEQGRVQPVALNGVQDLDEAGEIPWFLNVSIGPGGIGSLDVLGPARSGQDDDGQRAQAGRGANALQDLQAGQSRQVDVEQDEIGSAPGRIVGVRTVAQEESSASCPSRTTRNSPGKPESRRARCVI